MRKHIIAAIQAHAAAQYPKECCGLLLAIGKAQKYFPCRNTATEPSEEFRLDPEDYAAAEDLGEVIGIVHSHPDATSRPSPRDLAMCEATGLPWHILSWPEADLRSITPTGSTPLLNRPFVHGAWDCWQVCADWYKRERGIEFEAFQRTDGWWESKDSTSLYEANYEAAGFYRVDQPQRGDMIVMEVGRTVYPNHAGIFLGTDAVLLGEESNTFGPGPFLLHHLYGRPSEIIVFGGPWMDRARLILRPKMYNQPHDAAGPREVTGVEKIDKAQAVVASALTARLCPGVLPTTQLSAPTFFWDDSIKVVPLRQPEILDASEMLFIGLCSELEPENL